MCKYKWYPLRVWESTSKLPIKKSGCWSTISSTKWKESFTLNSLDVKSFKISTKNFASFVGRSAESQQNWLKWWTILHPCFMYFTRTVHNTWSAAYRFLWFLGFFCHSASLNKFFENFVNVLFLVNSKI